MKLSAFVLSAVLVLAAPFAAEAVIHHFTVSSIDGAQETPPNASLSTGSGTFALDTATGIATFAITHDCCASGELFSHVHGPGAPGVPAPIIYFLPNGSPKVGSSPVLTPQQQADMIAGLHYVNIHSNTFLGGEIRGQIILTGTTQLKPTKTLLVKNPPAGATKRKVLWKVRETASTNTVSGDPTVGGATLRVALTPGGDQCFDLPAANWSPVGSLGFKYEDADLSEGAVKVAMIKKSNAGTFLLKALLKGNGSETISVVPGNPTASYALNFAIDGGDEYCSATGTATPKQNDDKTFKVVNDTTPAACPVAACSPSGAFVDAPALF